MAFKIKKNGRGKKATGIAADIKRDADAAATSARAITIAKDDKVSLEAKQKALKKKIGGGNRFQRVRSRLSITNVEDQIVQKDKRLASERAALNDAQADIRKSNKKFSGFAK